MALTTELVERRIKVIKFNIDERSIISIYKGINHDRTFTINEILTNINHVEEVDLKELMNRTAEKLKKLMIGSF